MDPLVVGRRGAEDGVRERGAPEEAGEGVSDRAAGTPETATLSGLMLRVPAIKMVPSIEICSPHFLHFIRARFPAIFSSGTLNFAEQAEQLTNMVMAGSQCLLPALEVPRPMGCRK